MCSVDAFALNLFALTQILSMIYFIKMKLQILVMFILIPCIIRRDFCVNGLISD